MLSPKDPLWPDDLLDEIQRTVVLDPDVFCLTLVVRDGVVIPCGVLLSRQGRCSVHGRAHPFSQVMYFRLWQEQPQREQARMRLIMARAGQMVEAISRQYQIDVDVFWLASLCVEYGLEPKWEE